MVLLQSSRSAILLFLNFLAAKDSNDCNPVDNLCDYTEYGTIEIVLHIGHQTIQEKEEEEEEEQNDDDNEDEDDDKEEEEDDDEEDDDDDDD